MIHIFKNLKFDGKQINSTFEAKYFFRGQIFEARSTFDTREKKFLGPTLETKLRPGQI